MCSLNHVFLELADSRDVYDRLAIGDIPETHEEYSNHHPEWIQQELYCISLFKFMRLVVDVNPVTRQEDNYLVNHGAQRVILFSGLIELKENRDYEHELFEGLYHADSLSLLHLVKRTRRQFPNYEIGFRANGYVCDKDGKRILINQHSVFITINKVDKRWQANYFDANKRSNETLMGFRQFGSLLHLRNYKRYVYKRGNPNGTCFATSFVAMIYWINNIEKKRFAYEKVSKFKGFREKVGGKNANFHMRAHFVRELYPYYELAQIKYYLMQKEEFCKLKNDTYEYSDEE